jgi:hypothetical protein
MADRKISDLTALTTPASGDFLPIVDISEAAAASKNKRITIEELMRGVPDGTAAAPGIAFETDPNTGIYSPGADQVGIATNGSSRMTVSTTAVTSTLPVLVNASGTSAIVSNLAINGGELGSRSVSITDSTTNDALIYGSNAGSLNLQGGAAQPGAGIRITGRLRGTDPATIQFFTASSSNSLSSFERLRITSAGLVGIGTSVPSFPLHVVTSGNSGLAVYTGTSGANQVYLGNTAGESVVGTLSNQNFGIVTNGGQKVTVTTGGNVGIGTTSPTETLNVVGGNIKVDSSARRIGYWEASSTNDGYIVPYTAGGEFEINNTFTSGAITFRTGTARSERARIDSSGRLLVGTSTARSNLSPAGNTAQFQVEGASNDTNKIAIISSLSSAIAAAPAGIYLSRAGSTGIGSTVIVADNNQLGQITFQGCDGTNFIPAASITSEVDGTPGANDMPGRLVFSTTADGSSSPTERMRITNGGRILVGITSATTISADARLQTSNLAVEVASDTTGSWWNRTDSTAAWVAQRFHAQGSLSGFIQVNTSSVTYATTSDHRLKENVVDLEGAIARLKQLQVRRFNFIADPNNTVDGFIAHEMQEVVPECVTGAKDAVDDDGNPVYQGIDQAKLVPLLTAALQEAIGEIESLKARVAALEGA